MPDVLHFKGDISRVDFDQMLGPDLHRRYLKPLRWRFDANADHFVLELKGILPDEYRERVNALVAKELERERIRELFNAES